MVGIQGLGGVPEPKPERPAKVRDGEAKSAGKTSAPNSDNVVISSEAQAAAKIATAIKALNTVPDVRAERVAAAKERIDRGEYRNPDVVAKVAERISKYLP